MKTEFPPFLKNLGPLIYLSNDYVVTDFETSNIDYGSALNEENRIILGAFKYDNEEIEAPGFGTIQFDSWINSLSRVDFIVAHNAKFELQWLYRLGVNPGSILVWDTMLAEYCARGNLRGPLDLESVCAEYGIKGKSSIVATWIANGVDPCLIPIRRLREYCENDVEITHQLFLKQRERLQELGLLPVFFTRCLTTLVLSEIEGRGMCIDKPAVEKEFRKTLAESRKLLEEIDEVTGGINPKSPKQVAEFLYDKLRFEEIRNRRTGEPERTPSGGRKTDEGTISQLKAVTLEQRRFSDLIRAYAPIKKRLETLTKLYDCGQAGEYLHASFNTTVTATHRLSSSGKKYKVQFQNIDRSMKSLFRARNTGWKMGSADGKQLEFRVAAFLGQDEVAFEDINNNVDVHKNSGRVIFNKKEISKDERYEAKKYTFKPLFGASRGSDPVGRYVKWFQEHYTGIYKTQESWTYEVAKTKQLRIASGLIFYWPDCKVDSRGNVSYKTNIFNYPVQSFATADIIPITLIYTWYRMRGMRSFLINTIHDSVLGEIHPDEEQEWTEIVKQSFTEDAVNYLDKVYGVKFNVKLGVTYDIGEYWDGGKEEEYEWKIKE